MSKLATAAIKLPKIKRDEAQELLRDLHEQHPEALASLARLYTYFMPPRGRKPKSDWDWVASVINENGIRTELHYVHVTAGYIEATDGRRLHRAPNADGRGPGLYLPNGDPLELDAGSKLQFPDTQLRVPRRQHCKPVRVVPGETEIVEGGAGKKRRYVWAATPEFGIDAALLESAAQHGTDPVDLLLRPEAASGQPMFVWGDLDDAGTRGRFALISPWKL